MPFKIVKTFNIKKQQHELCICPSGWERHGYLHWPNRKGRKLSRIEDSTPAEDWTIIKCITKRNNIPTYEIADEQLSEMLNCSTTETEIDLPICTVTSATPAPVMQDFNSIAQQASSASATVSPVLPVAMQNQILEEVPDQVASQHQVTGEHQVTGQDQEILITIKEANLEKIITNQELILGYQRFLQDNFFNLQDNQTKIMKSLAEITVQLDNLITNKNFDTVVPLKEAKKSSDNTVLCLKPIKNLEELIRLEKLLSDDKEKEEIKLKYSIVCQKGKAVNCAYKLVDIFFDRNFLTQCSWSGSARGSKTKISLKIYKNFLNLFFELVYDCDKNYTIDANECFFKSVLKNSTKRKHSTLQRSSTSRNSHKRQKTCETKSNENTASTEEITPIKTPNVPDGTDSQSESVQITSKERTNLEESNSEETLPTSRNVTVTNEKDMAENTKVTVFYENFIDSGKDKVSEQATAFNVNTMAETSVTPANDNNN